MFVRPSLKKDIVFSKSSDDDVDSEEEMDQISTLPMSSKRLSGGNMEELKMSYSKLLRRNSNEAPNVRKMSMPVTDVKRRKSEDARLSISKIPTFKPNVVESPNLDRLQESRITQNYFILNTGLLFLYGLLVMFGVTLTLHFVYLINTFELVINAYSLLGLFLSSILLLTGIRGVVFVRYESHDKYDENTLLLVFAIVLTCVNFGFGFFVDMVGSEVYRTLHSTSNFIINFAVIILFQFITLILNSRMSSYYSDYYYLFRLNAKPKQSNI